MKSLISNFLSLKFSYWRYSTSRERGYLSHKCIIISSSKKLYKSLSLLLLNTFQYFDLSSHTYLFSYCGGFLWMVVLKNMMTPIKFLSLTSLCLVIRFRLIISINFIVCLINLSELQWSIPFPNSVRNYSWKYRLTSLIIYFHNESFLTLF